MEADYEYRPSKTGWPDHLRLTDLILGVILGTQADSLESRSVVGNADSGSVPIHRFDSRHDVSKWKVRRRIQLCGRNVTYATPRLLTEPHMWAHLWHSNLASIVALI